MEWPSKLWLPSGPGAKDAVRRIKEYIEQGYTRAVVLDLSKYFDTLNHNLLLYLLRQQVKDERVIQMIKRYLKSGVMENGVVARTEKGLPQGGNRSLCWRMCIWKQWKLSRTRKRKLIGLGVDSHYAATIAYDRKGYWFSAGNKAVNWALNKERLINWGFYDLAAAYQSLHVNYWNRRVPNGTHEHHFENSNLCSPVKKSSSPSKKNCAKVIANALHTASEVGGVGALFLLNIFVTVEWERFASFANR